MKLGGDKVFALATTFVTEKENEFRILVCLKSNNLRLGWVGSLLFNEYVNKKYVKKCNECSLV